MRKRSYITLAALLMSLFVSAQNTDEGAIRRSVTLYNPYKPTLQETTKRATLPAIDDTSKVKVDFNYVFKPGTFLPYYKVSPIKSASLSPEPLPKIKKGYVSFGAGTYYSPFLEISVTNDRSKRGTIGAYTRSYASAGKVRLDDGPRVFAGFMDNEALLYGKKYYRRGRFDADIDFKQMSRYAYGYNTDITGYDPARKDIRALYFDVTGTARYCTMESDSNDINWDALVKYNFFNREGEGMQHNPGLSLRGGRNIRDFYGGLTLDYDLYLFSEKIDTRSRNLISLAPYVARRTDDWRFSFGLKTVADIKENQDPLMGGKLKAYMFLYPDVSFTFRIVPDFLRFSAAVDGYMENNQAGNIAYVNPYLVPGDTMFTLRNTDNKLRVAAGFSGNMNVSATYSLDFSFTLFDDMLFFMNDTINEGNYFVPVYDDGDLFRVHGEIAYPVNRQLAFSVSGNYYRYSLSVLEHPWHKPGWDGSLQADYNLRNKIIASASLKLLGERYAKVAVPEKTVTLPVHANLNLGVEYRYTPALSFWLKMNNLSYKRYYEWNYYPAQNFMLLAGFTYSL